MSRASSRRRRAQRRSLLLRDGPVCFYCGRPSGTGLPFSRLTLDHVLPVSKGGANAQNNLVLACKLCNRAKGDKLPEEFMAVAS